MRAAAGAVTLTVVLVVYAANICQHAVSTQQELNLFQQSHLPE